MLKLVIPKGSLEEQTLRLFEAADLQVRRGSSRDYHGTIDDDRIDRVSVLRPQEIPIYVQDGLFDLGITGQDWIAESGSDVEVLTGLSYAKTGTGHGTTIVLAVPNEHPANTAAEMPPNSRISTEFVRLTERHFADLGIPVKVRWSYGATEAKVPEIVDAIVDVTETGSTLRAHGMKIIATLLTSEPVLVANREAAADPVKRAAMDDITTLLLGALAGRGPSADQAQRLGRRAGCRARGGAVDEGPHRVPAHRRRLRDRNGGGQAGGQPADPRVEGRRRHRHPRAAHLQDRALTVPPQRTYPPRASTRRDQP